MSTLVRGMAVIGAVALVVAMPSTTGLSSPWPVLLVAAVAFARPVRPGVAGAFLTGAAAWWLAMALRAGVLPDATWAEGLAAIVAVVVCVAAAGVSGERMPLFAGLGGTAAFAALYEPAFAEAPTEFLTASPLAFGSVVVATGLGFLAATAAATVDAVDGQSERDLVAPLHTEAA